MKSLKTLIKLYKKRLDDKRLELAREEQALLDLQKILTRIRKEMVDETNTAKENLEVRYTFPIYIEQALNTEKRVLTVIAEQEEKLEKLRDEMAEEFSELKKYEILLEMKVKKEREEEDKIEQSRLDEIATNTFLQELREGS